MRLTLAAALALLLLAPLPARAGEAGRRLVVQLSATAARDDRSAGATAPSGIGDRARARFAALGLRATRTLRDRLAPSPLRAALPAEFGFAPERIVLVEAADESLAAAACRLLATDPLVDWVEPVVTRELVEGTFTDAGRMPIPGEFAAATLDSLPNDPLLRATKQWGLYNVGPTGFYGGVLRADAHAPEAWRVSVGDNALKLAYADTGIDPAQPELGGTMPDGTPRIVDAINVTDEFPPVVTDSAGHGTPVAGVFGSRTNDGAHFGTGGTAGVCGGDGAGNAGCRIVPIKIAPGHSGEATSFDIARAILHATDVGARAMNLSFAGDTPSRLERLALQVAITHGCVVVCAAGNRGASFPTQRWWPAAYAIDGLCLSVGASTSADRRAMFSSYPAGLDLVAPGENIMTTYMTYPSAFGVSYPGYVAASGTSFAAPFVTGGVGLLCSIRPELMDTDFQRVLRESADDIGATGIDAETAHGRLNLRRALDAVRPSFGVWHDETTADSFVVEAQGTLRVGERTPGTMSAHYGTPWATRIAAYATVSLPDSFLDSVRVWPRVGGTLAARGDFDLEYFAPSATVTSVGADRFVMRGFLYRVDEDSCGDAPVSCGSDDSFVPLAPSNVRFGFTVLGRVDRPPSLALQAPAPDTTLAPGDSLTVAWTASDPDKVTRVSVTISASAASGGGERVLGEAPASAGMLRVALPCLDPATLATTLTVCAWDEHGHADHTCVSRSLQLLGGTCSRPLERFAVATAVFTGSLEIAAPGPGIVQVLDAAGRRVRALPTRGGALAWDGRDERGAVVRAGVYFVRFHGDAGTAVRRVVRLGR